MHNLRIINNHQRQGISLNAISQLIAAIEKVRALQDASSTSTNVARGGLEEGILGKLCYQ